MIAGTQGKALVELSDDLWISIFDDMFTPLCELSLSAETDAV
jgi:hypothetical protein